MGQLLIVLVYIPSKGKIKNKGMPILRFDIVTVNQGNLFNFLHILSTADIHPFHLLEIIRFL